MSSENDSDVEIAQEPGLAGYLPTGFGTQRRTANIQAQLDEAKRKVTDDADDAKKKEFSKSSDEEDSDDDSDDSNDDPEFPVTHELVIPTNNRAVTSATLDAGGNRLITGSADCMIKYHDIGSMNPTTIRAFKEIDPTATKTSGNNDSHPIHQVLFNPVSPASILAITALPQARIYSREGELLGTTTKGDMYLRDMHNTKGHISEITCGDWHPQQREVFVTAGTDSTLRSWNANSIRQQTSVIVHKSKQAGSAGRSRMTAVKYGSSATDNSTPTPFLATTAFDGSLAIWDSNGPFLRPSSEVASAHQPSSWTSSLDISPDGRLIISRGGDDALKLWDVRKLKTPLRETSHPSSSAHFPTSSIRFSPTGSNILVGAPSGHLHILNSATLRPELITLVSPGSTVTTAFWHPKLNQIIATSADGKTRVLFSPDTSKGGALTVLSKAPKRRHIDDDPARIMDTDVGFSPDAIVNPAARRAESGKKQTGLTVSGRSRDPRRPHMPETTPFGHSNPDEGRILERVPLSSMRDEDPREALLKYAEQADKDRIFTKAWSQTQPKAVFAEVEEDEEEPEAKRAKR